MFETLHLQLWPELFGYFTQLDLINCILVSHLFHREIARYLATIVLMKLDGYYETITFAVKNNMIISLNAKIGTYYPIEHAFYEASYRNNTELINFFIKKKGAEISLCGAAAGGHWNLIEQFISLGAEDWINGLSGACHGGHLKIAKFMVAKLRQEHAQMPSKNLYIALSEGLYHASYFGHLELVKIMLTELRAIPETAHRLPQKIRSGFGDACRGNKMNVIQYFIDVEDVRDWNWGLENACSGNHFELAKYMISLGASNFNEALEASCCMPDRLGEEISAKNEQIIRLLVNSGATQCYTCYKPVQEHLSN